MNLATITDLITLRNYLNMAVEGFSVKKEDVAKVRNKVTEIDKLVVEKALVLELSDNATLTNSPLQARSNIVGQTTYVINASEEPTELLLALHKSGETEKKEELPKPKAKKIKKTKDAI